MSLVDKQYIKPMQFNISLNNLGHAMSDLH